MQKNQENMHMKNHLNSLMMEKNKNMIKFLQIIMNLTKVL